MEIGLISFWGGAVVALILVPNILYALRHKDFGFSSENRIIHLIEQTGRYGCILFMVAPLGAPGGKFGFRSPEALVMWVTGMALLLGAYYICWLLFARSATARLAMALALLPCGIFLLHAVLMRHWVLAIFTGIFTGAHVYITRNSTRRPKDADG